MLSDDWWQQRTTPRPPSLAITEDIARWQLAQVAHDLVWRWHTSLGVVPYPSQPGNAFPPLIVASPQCLRSPACFALLDDNTKGWSSAPKIDDLPLVQIEPGNPRALGVADARKAFFSALKLEKHLAPGHENCFHRRAKDITPVMWTIGLLICTHNGTTWHTTRTWDTIIDSTRGEAQWTNGHSLSAYYEAMNTPKTGRTWSIEDLGAAADGRAIVISEWTDPSGRWPAVVLQNDGLAFIRGEQIDIGARWRAGDDLPSLAVELAERAQLLTLPDIAGQSFTGRDRNGNELRWEDGVFSSNWPPFLDAVQEMLDSGAWVTGGSTMPQAQADTRPGWVALFTASEALRLDDLEWDDRQIVYPDSAFGLPPGAVS